MVAAHGEAGERAPRVTVIMATYNWSSVLPYSIGSALHQDFEDFELLVVGDHCTDDSAAVVRHIAERDARVRWINLPENAGNQFGPNNEGLRQARGEYVAYLGHDDVWLPHHLRLLASALDSGADAAHAMLAVIRTEGEPPQPGPRYWHNSIPPTSIMHRRSMTEQLGGWRDYRVLPKSLYPDSDLWDRARAAGFSFELLPRLTSLKLPVASRPNVYAERPSHEQAFWSEQILRRPQLEAELLAVMVREAQRRARPAEASAWKKSFVWRALYWSYQRARRAALGKRSARVPHLAEQTRAFKGLAPHDGDHS